MLSKLRCLKDLGLKVVKTRRAHSREADDEDRGLRTGRRAKAVVVLLSGNIPQLQTDLPAIGHALCTVTME
jgi:hypothetical protein